ncbi:MAG: hypothetical protein ACJ8ER_09295 [Allosphingosinicella sp.]
MASYDRELLEAARTLIARQPGARGRLPRAKVRRSLSTAYYALFHFLLEEASRTVIGTTNVLSRRRRIFARLFTHRGLLTALTKIRGQAVEESVADFLRGPATAPGAFPAPVFARDMALAFQDAQTKRHDADYDLNKPMTAEDAALLIDRVDAAITGWRQAGSEEEKDFKRALSLLMLMKGQLRREEGA